MKLGSGSSADSVPANKEEMGSEVGGWVSFGSFDFFVRRREFKQDPMMVVHYSRVKLFFCKLIID